MTKLDTGKLRNQAIGEGDLNEMLDIFLALDRAVVEFSIVLYNVPRRDKVAIRQQNRRLHDALRERLLIDPADVRRVSLKRSSVRPVVQISGRLAADGGGDGRAESGQIATPTQSGSTRRFLKVCAV